jgi:hypothetical protein
MINWITTSNSRQFQNWIRGTVFWHPIATVVMASSGGISTERMEPDTSMSFQ